MKLLGSTFRNIALGAALGLSSTAIPEQAIAQAPQENIANNVQKKEDNFLERLRNNFNRSIDEDAVPLFMSLGLLLSSIIFLIYSSIKDRKKFTSEIEKIISKGNQEVEKVLADINFNNPVDIDKVAKSLREFLNKQPLPKEEELEIKKVLTDIAPTVRKLQQIKAKKELTVGNKNQLEEIFFKLDDLLNELWISLGLDKEDKVNQPQNNIGSTAIKILNPNKNF
ncbi:MAG: hypothetical protein HY094_04815 [Candidatus Melainabacteria bacterium]|nr:hypothetical protein [Candidatus Melainabacteria bacterium]